MLMHEGKTLYSEAYIDPNDYLQPVNESKNRFSGVIGGKNILIVGGETNIKGNTYSVYVVEDITPVYGNITAMIWRFILIGVIGVAIGLALIILLV